MMRFLAKLTWSYVDQQPRSKPNRLDEQWCDSLIVMETLLNESWYGDDAHLVAVLGRDPRELVNGKLVR